MKEEIYGIEEKNINNFAKELNQTVKIEIFGPNTIK